MLYGPFSVNRAKRLEPPGPPKMSSIRFDFHLIVVQIVHYFYQSYPAAIASLERRLDSLLPESTKRTCLICIACSQ